MIESEVVRLLNDKKLKIATAESCTGGLLAKRITDVSGASNVFEMGIVSYSNRIKNEFLGVENSVLDTVGAVSEETARQMARGISKISGSDIGVGITGFAGPTGDKVGLVYLAIYFKGDDSTTVKELMLSGSREEIREQASDIAFNSIYYMLKNLDNNILI